MYVELTGVGPIQVNNFGYTFDSTIPGFQYMPNTSINSGGADSWTVAIPLAFSSVTFTSTGKPFNVDVSIGPSNLEPDATWRFHDVVLPAGATVTVTRGDYPTLTWAGPDGSGSVNPVTSGGGVAPDVTPPDLTIGGQSTITITATDSGSGVARVFYSTDGTHARLYTGPFAIDSSVTTVYAFADDFAGNRSQMATYLIPSSLRATTVAYRGDASGVFGTPMTLSATLTTASDGAPVAGQAIAFRIDGVTITATTDAAGHAAASFNPTHAGVAAVTVSFAGTPAYQSSTAAASLPIGKAMPVVTWPAPSPIVYGTPLGAMQLDAAANVPGTFTYAPSTAAVVDAGTQTLQCVFTPADSSDYLVATSSVAVTVTKASLVVIAAAATTTYGTAPSPLGGSMSGIVNNDAIVARFATTAAANSPVGTYPITAVLSDPNGRLRNYDLRKIDATLAIVPAPLTVTAVDTAKQYSRPMPSFLAAYDGFVLGETPAVLGGTLAFTTAATPFTGPGRYAATPSGLASMNYAIRFVPGTLTVLPEDARVTWTGARIVSTTGPNSGVAAVTLAATVEDLAATGDAAGDLWPGDIRTATLTFVDRSSGNTLCTAAIDVVRPGMNTVAAGTCTWKTALTAISTVDVGLVVGGYYARNSSADDATVLLAPPAGHFITGGGFLVASSDAAGALAPDASSNVRFEIEAQYVPGDTAIHGRFVADLRQTGSDGVTHSYELLVSSLSSAGVSADATTAAVTGSGIITDVTDPSTPRPVASDTVVVIAVTQATAAREATLGITAWKEGGGLWLSTSWQNFATAERPLAGGAVRIH